MKRISPALVFLLVGCAHSYSLKPLTDKPALSNGIELNTLVTKKCVLQAGYQDGTPEEMLIHVKVYNKSETSFDINPSSFSLTAKSEILKDSPLVALDPERYLQELEGIAEAYEARTKMESYQGIDALGTLDSDRQIVAAQDQYKAKQKESAVSTKDAANVRKRMAHIKSLALRKTTLKSGDSVEGAIVIRAAFKNEGVVFLESAHTACAGELHFLLKK